MYYFLTIFLSSFMNLLLQVETTSDENYMIADGVSKYSAEHAVTVARAALQFISRVNDVEVPVGKPRLQIRCGELNRLSIPSSIEQVSDHAQHVQPACYLEALFSHQCIYVVSLHTG